MCSCSFISILIPIVHWYHPVMRVQFPRQRQRTGGVTPRRWCGVGLEMVAILCIGLEQYRLSGVKGIVTNSFGTILYCIVLRLS